MIARTHEIFSWRDIDKLRRSVLSHFSDDRFLKTVFQGCLRVGRDTRNPLRGNFVASGLREATGHILHSLAPDDEVRRCVWFEQAKDTPTITRRQRANYIVHAGLPTDFVSKILRLDVKNHTNPLLTAMDRLNRATHVRPETIISSGVEVRSMLQDVLLGIGSLTEAVNESRNAINKAVADVMHEAVFDNLISDTIQDLDELSTHTMIDGHYIEMVEVIRINSTEITYHITGQVEVELQYGSDSDVDHDLGYRQDESYPYKASVTCKAAEPMNVRADDIHLQVDNRSFYE